MGTSKLSGKPDEMLGVTYDGLASHPGGVAILLVASCYGNRNNLQQYWTTRLGRLNLITTVSYDDIQLHFETPNVRDLTNASVYLKI